jgi:methylthioribose-1-phosphate isomerase
MEVERTIWWDSGICTIDQTKLPESYEIIKIGTVRTLVEAIKSLRIRGAPALGAAGGYGVALAAHRSTFMDPESILGELKIAAEMIRSSRPTAVNLAWGVDRVLKAAQAASEDGEEAIRSRALAEAERIADEDIAANRAIGKIGSKQLDDGDRVLTHCNAGRLACVGWGTALGVIRSAVEEGKSIEVYSCETRPLNQGSRLTAWELSRDGIPVTLICDGAAASLMRQGKIDKAIVGADRVTEDAVFNKIGTYSHALSAKANQIPFYVAAPISTFDQFHLEHEIEIEERSEDEVLSLNGKALAPKGVHARNPAFDATPIDLLSGIITEKGMFRPPLMPFIGSGLAKTARL